MRNAALGQLLRGKLLRDQPLTAPAWLVLALVGFGFALGVFGAIAGLYSVVAIGAVLILAAPYVRWRGGNG